MTPGAGLTLAAIDPAGQIRRLRSGTSFESAKAGDFEKDQAFSFGAWIKVPGPGVFGSVIARMDDRSNYRGWDMWLEGGRIATHLVNHWPSNALKVVARGVITPGVWTHVFITYDGSARATGVKIYINGQPQETDVHADVLKSTIRTQLPLKIGQRHTGSRIDR